MRVVLVALAACGSSKPPPMPVGPPAALVAPGAGDGDVVVAKVNGRPVWGSCVATQAKRGAARDAALRQCIDFELLAQAAEQRGFATNPDVIDQTRVAMVSSVVDREYEQKFDSPDDFGPFWQLVTTRSHIAFPFKHEEYRASTYVRVPIKDPPPADDADKHALADKIAAAVANERGLTGPQFLAIVEPLVPGGHLVQCREHEYVPCTQTVGLRKIGGLDNAYGDALWAIPEVGRASPVVRTSLGWDVIAWTADEPAKNPPPDELVRELVPAVKVEYFDKVWVWSRSAGPGTIAKQLGVHVDIDPKSDALLEALP